MAIRMKVEKSKKSKCCECNTNWKDTREMYTILLGGSKITLCSSCLNDLFTKCLRMQTIYNSRLKSNEDLKRTRNEEYRLHGEIENRLKDIKEEK
jgi:hypothetical protein